MHPSFVCMAMCAQLPLLLPCSILWLLRFPPYGEPHVKAEAAARGVDPARIIFTDVAAKPIHIARSGTFLYLSMDV